MAVTTLTCSYTFFANLLAWLCLNLFPLLLSFVLISPLLIVLASSALVTTICQYAVIRFDASLEFLIAFVRLLQLFGASEPPSSRPAAPTTLRSRFSSFNRLAFGFKVTFLFFHILGKFCSYSSYTHFVSKIS